MKVFIIYLLLLHSAISAFAITKTSTGTGNWGTAGTWSPSGVPANGDDVIIVSGHIVTLNTNTNTLLSLSVNGTLSLGDNTARTITVSGSVTVSSTGTITIANFNDTHSFIIGGNISNAGVFDMVTGGNDLCNVTFNGSANQTISGSGSTTDFNRITVNNTGAANNNIVEILPTNFTAAAGFLTLTRGIIKMSGSYTFTNTFFNTASPTINSDEGIWLNNANVTVTGQGGDTYLYGLIRISAGTYNIGNAADWWLWYQNGAILTIEGGALNVAGAITGYFAGAFYVTATITYTQSGGIVTVNRSGNTLTTASFEIFETGSSFTMSGGTIVLQTASTVLVDYINFSTNATVTGGVIQVGNTSTPASSRIMITSTPPLYNLVINSTNSPVGELRVNTTVLNDITVNSGSTLDVSPQNVNIDIGHDWFNNGTFTQGTATVTFNGSGAQQIAGSASTTFHNFTVNKSANSLTLNRATRINGSGTFTAGIVNSTSTNLLTFSDDATTTGANNGAVPSYVNGPVRKEGNDAFTFPVGKTGAGYRFCGISAPGSTGDIFTAEFFRASASALGSISAGAAPLHHVSNCEYWDIDEDGPGSPTVDVILSWSNLSNCSILAYVNNAATLCIAHFNGTQWDSYGGLGSAVGAPWPTAGTLTWTGVNTFSPFTLGSTSAATNPLPVTLVNVKAYRNGSSNKIEWTNLTESDVLVYEVQRSVNGTAFVTMSSLEARRNASNREDYAAIDILNSPVTYYRIKVTGIDGKIVYSPIVKLAGTNQIQADMVVYPNPVTGKQVTLQLNAAAGNYSLRVFSANGQVVKTETIIHPGGSYSKTIELPGQLPTGHYYLQVTGGEQILSSKLIIQ